MRKNISQRHKKSRHSHENDFDSASSYFERCFLQNQSNLEKPRIFPHFTNATDTKNIEIMFSHACDIIIQKRLVRSGMF
uniref:Ovule protein n=1 Tax=Acrobeloides nanus TaxID=290746 RepID=A0A914C0C0_9BILA